MAMNIQSGDTDGSGDPIPEYVGKKDGVRVSYEGERCMA